MLRVIVIGSLLAALGLQTQDDYEATRDAFLEQINATRAVVSARPLRLSAALSEVAQRRADEMAAEDGVPGPAGEEDARRALALGYDARVLSEFTAQADGDLQSVVAGWQSKGGTTEFTGSDYREMGLGVSLRRDMPIYVLVLALSWKDFFYERTDSLHDLEGVRGQMLARVNRERASRGLTPLRRHPRLDEAAQAHADDMFRRGYYSHDTPEGATALERARAKGYRAKSAGENIARGQYSVDAVMKGWMGSPTHREHLLSPRFSDVGFGLAFGKGPGGYEILWVQDFGHPEPARFAGQLNFLNRSPDDPFYLTSSSPEALSESVMSWGT